MTARGRQTLARAACVLTAVACAALISAHGLLAAFSDASELRAQPTRRAIRTAVVWPEGTVDVNTADAETLCTLKGIGPALAAAILAERERGGPFDHPEDLLCVKGIGPKTLARFRDQLDFSGR